MLGPAGAGKGTQAQKLAKEFSFAHISTGDLIRAEIKSGSQLGNKVKAIVEAGNLVSDDIVNEIVKASLEKMESDTAVKGFILDGYPRTIGQAKFFDTYSRFDHVFDLLVPRETLVKRLTGRRMCSKEKDPKCTGTFHVEFNPPKVDGICDLCGSKLIQRKDDSPEIIENRLSTYDGETGKPLTDYYSKQGTLITIDGTRDQKEIFDSLRIKLSINPIIL